VFKDISLSKHPVSAKDCVSPRVVQDTEGGSEMRLPSPIVRTYAKYKSLSAPKLEKDKENMGEASGGQITSVTEAINVQLNEHGRTELALEDVAISEIDALIIAAKLRKNPSVTSVLINSYSLGDEGAKELATLLKHNPLIRRFRLHANKKMENGAMKKDIGHKGGIKLGRMLEENHSLVHLDLSNNLLVPEAMIAIADALAHNNVLKTLNLSGNVVTSPVVKALSAALARNGALKQLILKNCKMTTEGIMTLLSCLKFNRTLISIVAPQTNIFPKVRESYFEFVYSFHLTF
jgi:Ran GTPase-activating protein (RanGAP) involved in mRNA processing and transport